jgi:hypothetical protein
MRGLLEGFHVAHFRERLRLKRFLSGPNCANAKFVHDVQAMRKMFIRKAGRNCQHSSVADIPRFLTTAKAGYRAAASGRTAGCTVGCLWQASADCELGRHYANGAFADDEQTVRNRFSFAARCSSESESNGILPQADGKPLGTAFLGPAPRHRSLADCHATGTAR